MSASSRETVLCRYHYDPLDRLVDRAPYEQAGIQRFYCKSRLATEIQGVVQRSVFQHDERLLAQRRHENARVNTALLATDQQHSVLNVLDATGPHPFAYTPYGHRPAENGLLSLLGFNGEPPDPVTGHYSLGSGYRVFNPVLMRFNSPDSLSPFGDGGLNAYGYCAGDPINWTDPTGHIPIKPVMDAFLKNLAKQGLRKTPMKKLAADRSYRQSMKRKANLIDQNEKLLKNQSSYSVSDNLTDLKTSLEGYNKAKQGYHFDRYPDPNVKYEFEYGGQTVLDTTPFDITISHFKNLYNRPKTNNYNKLNPATPLNGRRTITSSRQKYIEQNI
ncbi:RHS repeat-associated core domain-containing protein [Pseudomonas sp. R3-56]|uniref:RHS repeat-associated core domain-containing protein n=1 Tax=Pseudomonas sp. R3-56 TaxID=2817401 RepID=UPI003DAA021F